MFVRKSKYEAERERAKVSGAALSELTGELIKGMAALGYEPDAGPSDVTTAGKAILALTGVSWHRDHLQEEVETLRLALRASEGALREIAAMQTDNCAHIGKRMADRARKALPGGGIAFTKHAAPAASNGAVAKH
ncbi:MAG: hypothetical protein J7500_15555 [Sphingomonas sp.]|uniref:hypothetical protein n=1 Tax=Sphingomonas sp. TaxID=28214 RepID=UPI001B011C9C|nr:hypothetical protein [Sphingomonas sp.]MBO9624123.1 hypothetical protein [Sphingomonas sp.]